MKGPFSAFRPFTEKYPVRSYAILFALFFLIEATSRKDYLFSDGFFSDDVGEVVFMSMFFAAGLFVFIRYITRYMSAGRDK